MKQMFRNDTLKPNKSIIATQPNSMTNTTDMTTAYHCISLKPLGDRYLTISTIFVLPSFLDISHFRL